jgi:hypothetical protein
MACCCILAGDTDWGGLAIVMPVEGLMIGMALPRVRVAAGWCNFRPELWLWNEGGMNAGEVELREKGGATVVGCCVGEDSGDKLAKDDRSDEAIENLSLSVNRFGMKSKSSSSSKDRVASNFMR